MPVSELKKWTKAQLGYEVNKGVYLLQIGSHALDEKLAIALTIK